MTEILPNIYAVPVPKETTNVIVRENDLLVYVNVRDYMVITVAENLENFKILGTVTETDIDFDVEGLLPNHGMLNNKYAFRSLLACKGLKGDKYVIIQK